MSPLPSDIVIRHLVNGSDFILHFSHSFLKRTTDMPMRGLNVMRHVALCLLTPSSDTRVKGFALPCSFFLHHASFILHPSSFILHLSSFILQPSPFILLLSSFILHSSSFVIHLPSFILHPSSLILHLSSSILHLNVHLSSLILHPASFIIHPSSFIFRPSSFTPIFVNNGPKYVEASSLNRPSTIS